MSENQKRTISCPPGQNLNIRSAVYGKPPTCIAISSERIVKKLCNEKYTCTLEATNKVFGDPCRGVRKSLSVEYQCYLSGKKNHYLHVVVVVVVVVIVGFQTF